jgi:hypothetical protein
MSLPAGVTLGDAGSALWGAAYYEGQKIAGVVNGQYQLADGTLVGSATDADWQAIADAENANYATPAASQYRYQAQIDSPTTSPEIKTLLQNPEWKALQDTGPINWDTLSDTLKSQIQAIPNLYNNLIAGAWTPTATSSTTTPTASTDVAPALTSGPTATVTASGDSTVSRLMDVIAAGTSFNHSSGVGAGSSDGSVGGITITSPVASGTTSGSSPVKLIAIIGIIVAAWFVYKHHAKRAA